MTIRNLQPVVNTNTFDTWKNRTNEIITSLGNVATLGGLSANNDAQLYIDDEIKTSGGLYTDDLYPLDGATNRITVGTLASSPVLRTYLQEIFAPEGGVLNAIQFRFGETSAQETYAIGTGVDSDSLVFTGYYPGDVGVDPITSTFVINRSNSRDLLTGNAEPGLITGTNVILDDNLFPSEIRFSNVGTADRWKTPRTITFSDDFKTNDDTDTGPISIGTQGDVAGEMIVDGSGDLRVFLKVRDNSHIHDLRYFTKDEINENFTSISDGDVNYVLTAPEENPENAGEYFISEIIQGGVALRDNVQLIFGSNWSEAAGEEAVKMSYNRLNQNFIVRQKYGQMNFSVPNTFNFKYLDAATGIDSTKVYFDMTDGSIYADGDVTAFSDASDITLKDNIEIIPDALNKVSEIKGITFNYIDKPETRVTGLIAQDLEKVLPEAVYETNDNKKAIRYGNVVGLLVEAIKELQQEIHVLKEQING